MIVSLSGTDVPISTAKMHYGCAKVNMFFLNIK